MNASTTCGDLMTANPTCAYPSHTVEQVAQLMRDQNVGSIPVVESERSKRLVGIVTDRDMVLQVLAEGRSGQKVTVEQIMTRNPVTCRDIETMNTAFNVMSQHQVRRVPVVNKQGEIVGIISQADLAVRTNQDAKTADVVEEISRPDTANRY